MRSTLGTWVESYARAWEEVDAEAAAACLWTTPPTDRSSSTSPTSVDGVRAYWSDVTSTQSDVEVRMGRPIVEGHAPRWSSGRTCKRRRGHHAGGVPPTDLRRRRACRSLDEYYEFAQGRMEPPQDLGCALTV